jgi:hypothetical protein
MSILSHHDQAAGSRQQEADNKQNLSLALSLSYKAIIAITTTM